MPKQRLKVCGNDLANLRQSGLTDATIRANGLWSSELGDSVKLAEILNCGIGADACLGGLVFPYRDIDGTVNGFARVRPHYPRHKNGKPIRYEQPKGAALRTYFPKASIPLLNDVEIPIFVTEGEKKALALSQLGLAAIGIGGVDCWGKNSELLDELAELAESGREFFIVYDYDEKVSTRVNVGAAERRFAKALKAAGAIEVFSVKLPPTEEGGKQGIDDFLAASGADGELLFGDLVESAQPVLIEAQAENKIIKIIKLAPPVLADAAYLGFVGEFLRAVAPYTEATDAGVLAHLLPAVGTIVGPGPYVWAGNKQYARVNSVVVGHTNAGRKGTSFAPVNLQMSRVDPEFWSQQCVNGLSSGEGLINYVADRMEKNKDGILEEIKVEKRLLVVEEEFSRVLAQIRRDGNILSQIIRSAYDNGNLATLTVNPRHAFGSHISLVGHITPEELKERLNHIEMANGFGNRFLWFAVESDKVMASTKPIPPSVFTPFDEQLRLLHKIGSDCKDQAVNLDSAAQKLWNDVYPRLRIDQLGLAGAMVARGSSMVLRLALIYALLEKPKRSICIRVEHLEAALSVWDYSEESAHLLFDSETGDKLCNKLIALLRNGPMTKNDFNTHLSLKQKSLVGNELEKLEARNVIRKTRVTHNGAGRPASRWVLV